MSSIKSNKTKPDSKTVTKTEAKAVVKNAVRKTSGKNQVAKKPSLKNKVVSVKVSKNVLKATGKSVKKNNVKKQSSKVIVGLAKEAPRKIVSKVSLKKRVKAATKVVLSENIEPKKEILLPSNMSQRTVEKSMVLNNEFFNNFKNSAFKIAYTSGFCLIIVGASYASVGAFPKVSTKVQFANTGDLIDQEKVIGDLLPADIVQQASISEITDVPAHVLNTHPVTFRAVNASDVKVLLVKAGDIDYKAIVATRESGEENNGVYRFVIDSSQHETGKYFVRIIANSRDLSKIKSDTNLFYLGKKEISEVVPVKTLSNEVNTADKVTTKSDKVIPVKEIVSVKPAGEAAITEETSSEEPETEIETIPFRVLHSEGGTMSDIVQIDLSAPADYKQVYLYARPINSLNSRYISVVTKFEKEMFFIFNTNNIPDGQYEFFAQVKLDGKEISSTPLVAMVKNRSSDAVTNHLVNNEAFKVSDIVTIQQKREFVKAYEASSTKSSHVEDNVNREVGSLLSRENNNFDELLKRYSVAVQSGDETLKNGATKALQEEKERLVNTSLRNADTNYLSDNIDEELQNRLEDLKSKVEIFEQLRKDKSEGSTAVDTDNDGISNFDEVNLYGTDPNLVDTDNDGFTDGIEIIRGYDPLSPDSETIVKFQSPKESIGLVREDSLMVNEVNRVERPKAESYEASVVAEIRGKSLPNSFVTLYIFSSVTVVTIKTDADGSFVYTFDKELEDGNHEVYAAITDNAGEIIAQSNPFSFIKEAQAFTSVSAADSEIVSLDTPAELSKGSYAAVAGMGILALGLILIMLGITLRPKKDGGVEDGDDEEIYIDPTLPAGSPRISTKIEHIDAP